jgi:D-beta-D-heptose 7-phosphate kinase/D-beta-D-heptose 1-phosphate adenosyltransferase
MTEFLEPDQQTVQALLGAMTGRRVLVVGDGMLDGYIYGHSSRLSPEAPVQVVEIDREEYLLGGAANVAKCLVALGANVTMCCVIGDDVEGRQFIEAAHGLKIDTSAAVRDAARTTLKLRIVSGRQHVVRVDRDPRAAYAQKTIDELERIVEKSAAQADAVLLSDYDKGVLTPKICAAAIRGAAGKPVLVDPKGSDWKKYTGATLVKPNFSEARAFLAARDSSVLALNSGADNAECERIAQQLRDGLQVDGVMVTRGPHGISLSERDGTNRSFPGRQIQARDEAGAGDAVASATCLALASGASLVQSVWLGNLAGAVKVLKFGTHAITDFELI